MSHDTGRNIRFSPYYNRQQTLGAVFTEKSGWEQPQWYEANESYVTAYKKQIIKIDSWQSQYSSPIIGAEQIHAAKFAGLFDLTASRKCLEVSGEKVVDLLQKLTTSNVDIPIGSMVKTLMLQQLGGIKDEIKVIRTGIKEFIVFCSGEVEQSWITKHIESSSQIMVRDLTSGMCSLLIKGAKAKEIMQTLLPTAVSDESKVHHCYLKNVPVLSIYESINEMGSWEIMTTADHGLGLWDLLYKKVNHLD